MERQAAIISSRALTSLIPSTSRVPICCRCWVLSVPHGTNTSIKALASLLSVMSLVHHVRRPKSSRQGGQKGGQSDSHACAILELTLTLCITGWGSCGSGWIVWPPVAAIAQDTRSHPGDAGAARLLCRRYNQKD